MNEMSRKILTAAQVRQLPIDTPVRRHSYDQRGWQVYTDCRVIQNGPRSKALQYSSPFCAGTFPIRKETNRLFYSVEVIDE